MNRRRLEKLEAPVEAKWRRQWQAWIDRMHEVAWKPRLYDVLQDEEARDLADRILTGFIAKDPRLKPLGKFINEMVDAIPDPYPVDLTKWPRDLPDPPNISAEQVNVFREAATRMAAAAVAAEALYISAAEARTLYEERQGWKA